MRRCPLKRAVFLLTVFFATLAMATDSQRQDVLVVVGAPGLEEYREVFESAAAQIADACREAGNTVHMIGLNPNDASIADRDLIQPWIASIPNVGPHPAWLVYVGHGTWDGREARLNLRGADVTASEMRDWLAGFERPIVFVHGGPASAPFIRGLSGPNRVIVSATESGDELNYARFGRFFAAAISGKAGDFDQDGQVSLLEAFLAASHQVQTFYAEAGRMQTEHALIDDNGDGRGTPADWFRGTRVEKQSAEDIAAADGALAHKIALIETPFERTLENAQRSLRDAVEADLERLRKQKPDMPEADYLRELEALMRRLAPVYAPEFHGADDT